MNLAEAYSLFMYRLNPQLRQLVASGNLEEVVEIVKKAIVYGEEKSGSPQEKTENKQKWQSGSGGKGSKGNWDPSGGPKRKVQIISGDSK